MSFNIRFPFNTSIVAVILFSSAAARRITHKFCRPPLSSNLVKLKRHQDRTLIDTLRFDFLGSLSCLPSLHAQPPHTPPHHPLRRAPPSTRVLRQPAASAGRRHAGGSFEVDLGTITLRGAIHDALLEGNAIRHSAKGIVVDLWQRETGVLLRGNNFDDFTTPFDPVDAGYLIKNAE